MPNSKPPIPKSDARKLILERRKELTQGEILDKSKRIFERLIEVDDFVYAKKILAYVSSHPGEVDTKAFINHSVGCNKSIFLPKFYSLQKKIRRFHFTDWRDLVKNEEGFLEPKIGFDEDMSDIDMIIAPCVAVSMAGQRLGYGGGYYDNFLRKTYAPKYVLAFEFQIFNEIERNRHDIRVDKIITERRVIDTHEKKFYLN
jgi:5-formyltetrahydrofolate cyclo-ligase